MDFKPDAVFVTLRAYQLKADGDLTVAYDPAAVQIAVFPQSVDVVAGIEQGDEPPPAGVSNSGGTRPVMIGSAAAPSN